MLKETTYDTTRTNIENRSRAGVERQQNRLEVSRNKVAETAARNEFIGRVEKAAKHHPEIDHQVFKDIIAAYDAEKAAYEIEEKKIKETSEKLYQGIDQGKLRAQFMKNIHKRLEHHKGAGTAALHAIAEESAPESIFTPLVRMFYNTDKGGLQIGGAAGAAVAGGLAYYFTSSSGASSLLTYGITAAVALLGAYAGSQAFGGKDTTPTPNFKTPASAQGHAKTPEVALGTIPDLNLNIPDVCHLPGNKEDTNGYTPNTGPMVLTKNDIQV